MPDKLDQYRDDYIRESKDHIAGLNENLLILEKIPGDEGAIEALFRHAHTLKSMSAAMKLGQTQALCHHLESLLDLVRKNKLDSSLCIDVLFKAVDAVEKNVSCVENNKAEISTSTIMQDIQAIIDKQPLEASQESNSVTMSPAHKIEKVRSINVKTERLDRLMNLSEELLINKMEIDSNQSFVKNHDLHASLENLGHLVNELQYLVVQARLVPLEYIFNRFPRMVRDLAKHQDKKIDVQVQGASIELDRAIIDELGECLVHLLRNAIDHGIETKAERKEMKKFDMATIAIGAHRYRNKVIINISDDGMGLPINKIRKKALLAGLIEQSAQPEQIMNTIFSGLSTSDKVSEISGRGFGLSIVKQKVESLGGKVSVKSMPGKGCTFELELPLTLAIIRVLFIRCDGVQYAIPIDQISRLLKVESSRIKPLMQNEAIIIDEQEVPLVRLNRLFGCTEKTHKKTPVVVVHHQERQIGIAVDEFGIMQDVVIKPMNSLIRKNNFFSGSTVIGNGEVVLILDVANLGVTPSVGAAL
ncbi:MAG: chemotaxis protein CheA [Coxiellaceae bacterium]|nr:chemotaxis protein CheA [Coxiellaceae bacterium]